MEKCPSGSITQDRRNPEQIGWRRQLLQKKREYRVHQRLYQKDKARLAALVLDGTVATDFNLPIDTVTEAFRDRWGGGDAFHGLGDFWSEAETDNWEFYLPIWSAEVRENLAKMKSGSAPGPDRISKKALLVWDPGCEQLTWLYTVQMVHGVIPRVFKECRTRLLPKSGDAEALMDVNGWSLVTIGSLVLSLFASVIGMRLGQACPLIPGKRGFSYPRWMHR